MPDVSAFLSARAAAELAGVDERTVRRWVKAGTLAADKRGGRFLIPRSALDPFIGLFRRTPADRCGGADRADS
jgi:excisionase family DNA binding protein